MKPILDLQHITTGYGAHTILEDICLSLHAGEVMAIIGQNGCGKSTLLRTIARIISDNSGDIIFATMNLNTKSTHQLKDLGISYFVQGGMVFPTLTVAEHFNLALRGKSKQESEKIKLECFTYFPTLAQCMDTRGGNLSGGQRQMLSFGMLIAQQTDCWLLDEPTAGLSPEALEIVADFLHRMKTEKQKTMLLVEHNYSMAFKLADRVAIIKDSKIQGVYPPTEFQENNFLNQYLYN